MIDETQQGLILFDARSSSFNIPGTTQSVLQGPVNYGTVHLSSNQMASSPEQSYSPEPAVCDQGRALPQN